MDSCIGRRGDGSSSITWLEVKRARQAGKIVLPYILEDDASWPLDKIEGLQNPKILTHLRKFKEELKKTMAGFFSDPRSLTGLLSIDIPKAILRLEKKRGYQPPQIVRRAKAHPTAVLPWLYDPDNPPSVAERMQTGMPKRILSINGGGISCAICLGYLSRIEKILQIRYGVEDFRLADYFDLIGGIGPSSLIALELARRKSVEEAGETFKCVMSRISVSRSGLFQRVTLRSRFSDRVVRKVLEQFFDGCELGSRELTTGLAIITTSLESARPWIISNHPKLIADGHGRLSLTMLMSACLSVPGYLKPVILDTCASERRALATGELGVGSDPSLALLLMVTNPNYPFAWRLGRHRLLLASLGSSALRSRLRIEDFEHVSSFTFIQMIPTIYIESWKYQSRMLLDALASSSVAADLEAVDHSRVLTHLRYETGFDADSLAELNLKDVVGSLSDVRFGNRNLRLDEFRTVGQTAANRQIDPNDFSDAFDVRVPISAVRSEENVT